MTCFYFSAALLTDHLQNTRVTESVHIFHIIMSFPQHRQDRQRVATRREAQPVTLTTYGYLQHRLLDTLRLCVLLTLPCVHCHASGVKMVTSIPERKSRAPSSGFKKIPQMVQGTSFWPSLTNRHSSSFETQAPLHN